MPEDVFSGWVVKNYLGVPFISKMDKAVCKKVSKEAWSSYSDENNKKQNVGQLTIF